MIKEEFYYDSRDGKSKLHAVRYAPDDAENICCVVQIVHGMAEYLERYEEFAEFLTSKGCVVTGEDHMGHGKSVGENGKYGYFCEQDPATVLVRDVHRLKKATQALYPDVPYVIMGHSMGSFIVRNYMFRYGTGVSAAIIMGTGMQPQTRLTMARILGSIQKVLFGSEYVSRLMDKLAFGKYNDRIENRRTDTDWLSRDPERVDRYRKDPMCGFVFTVNGFLTLTGAGVRKAYDSLNGVGVKNIRLKLYEGARHELLNETNRDEVMKDIYDWLKDVVLQENEVGGSEGRRG